MKLYDIVFVVILLLMRISFSDVRFRSATTVSDAQQHEAKPLGKRETRFHLYQQAITIHDFRTCLRQQSHDRIDRTLEHDQRRIGIRYIGPLFVPGAVHRIQDSRQSAVQTGRQYTVAHNEFWPVQLYQLADRGQ